MTSTTSKSLRDNHVDRIIETDWRFRFGNFIGEEAGSEEASEAGVDAGDYVYDDEPEEAEGVTGQELMEIDGTFTMPNPQFTVVTLTYGFCRWTFKRYYST